MKFNKYTKVLIGILVFYLVLYLVGPMVYSNQSFFETLIIFTILTLSFNIVYGFTGYLPFGYAAFFGLGAYGFGIAVMRGFDIETALAMGGALSLLFAVIFIPMLRLKGAYFAIANLAAFEGIYYIFSNQSLDWLTRGPYGISIPSVYNFGETYVASVVILVVITVLTLYIKTSNIGLAFKAIKEDQTTASLSGINVPLYRAMAWMISALFAGFSGGLFAWYLSFFYPESVFSINYSLFVIVFTIFGGAGTLMGPIIGTIVLYSAYDTIGITYPEYFTLIFGIAIILLVLFLPNGLMDLISKYTKKEMV